MRILFTTAPLAGHFFPLVPLAWAARTLGHEVLVATSEDFVPAVLRSGLPAIACGPAGEFLTATAPAVGGTAAERRWAHGRVLAGIAKANLPRLGAAVRAWRPDVVVSERAEFAGPIAAAAAGVPRVEMRWGVAPLVEFRAAAVIAFERGGLPVPDLVLSPWPPSLRSPDSVAGHGIRHVPYNGDARVPEWLLEPVHRRRLCVTLGTVLPHLDAERVSTVVLPALNLLSVEDIEFVIAVDEDVLSTWPPLPAGTRHAGRLPLSELIATCDAVLHHGGQGTSLAALAAGCPQLVLPHFDDHFANADAIVRAGAGVRLRPVELSPWNVAKRVLDVLGSHRMRRAAATVAEEIASQPHPTEVIAGLEALIARRSRRAS